MQWADQHGAPIAWNEPPEDAEGEIAQLEPLLRKELQPTFVR
jgi:hypothetical protein